MASFRLAKRNKNTATIYKYLSFASTLASFSFIRSNRDLSFGLLGGSFVFSLFSNRHIIQYNQHLDKAIWQYNKDVLFPGNTQ
jgi:hypothetical protein